ncbi:XTP/dITP diphosphatase [Aneurinibacillus uraniidurans]|uniref:XTP/dITP diphosphatase n=1 Tax=Aneurinibacillus uraniidurans TaxID=2966586 RepID=UPI00234BD4C0|nr:XTP/dITP diphosphatase [Aneurinibacillus sp. B1]WCN38515.1 XTP/dITP diphosphatase [Aneurinibacillus sp. B1]
MSKKEAFPWESVVLATKNKGKIKEFTRMFSGWNVRVLTMNDDLDFPDVVEDGDTFEANARKKAEEIMRATGLPALADDSGLEVDALGGKPGVYSARFAGEHASDEENNAKLVQLMKDVPEAERTARFVSVLALALPEGDTILTRGTCEGQIVLEASGTNGFGYDPHFYLSEKGRTMAELEPDEKNAVSHRGVAVQKLTAELMERFA